MATPHHSARRRRHRKHRNQLLTRALETLLALVGLVFFVAALVYFFATGPAMELPTPSHPAAKEGPNPDLDPRIPH